MEDDFLFLGGSLAGERLAVKVDEDRQPPVAIRWCPQRHHSQAVETEVYCRRAFANEDTGAYWYVYVLQSSKADELVEAYLTRMNS